MVITVKFNGTTIAERSSVPVPLTATYEEVARLRLGEQAPEYSSMPLEVNLFPDGRQREVDRTGAAISDCVGGNFALGYAFAVLSFSAPVYGPENAPAKGVNKFHEMMAAARGDSTLCLPLPYKPSEEGGSLNFELSLFNAILSQCERQALGHRVCPAHSAQAGRPAGSRSKKQAEEEVNSEGSGCRELWERVPLKPLKWAIIWAQWGVVGE